MKILLDTPVFLWAVLSPDELSEEATELLGEGSYEKYLSAASAWEIVIKHGKGNVDLPTRPEQFVSDSLALSGIIPLPVTMYDALALADLPLHHEDVFDRQLIIQAQRHKMFLMTADPVFEAYDVQIIST
jgi:PIN domain nuclease of toxin-antitoxin system